MLVVQPRSLDGGDEELGSVGVWARVGHGEESRSCVLDQKVLVLKLGSVDRLTPCSVKPLKVAALQHELGDDPVEDGALVRETLLVLPGGDRYKICHSSGNNLNWEGFRKGSNNRAC